MGLRYSVKRIVQSGGGGEILRRVERPEQVLFTSTSLVLEPSSDPRNERPCGFSTTYLFSALIAVTMIQIYDSSAKASKARPEIA